MRNLTACTRLSRRFAAIAVLSAFAASPARAVDLINNMNYAANPDGADDVYNTSFTAMQFQTTALEYTVTQVQAKLLKNQSLGTGSYYFNIYADNGLNKPGTLLQNHFYTGDTSLLPSDGTFATVTASGLNITLSPSTKYWFAVNSDSTYARWGAYNSGSSSATGFPTLWSFTNNSGTSWSGTDTTYTTVFSVSAVAVPEPTTWAMGGIGLMTFGIIARQRTARLLA